MTALDLLVFTVDPLRARSAVAAGAAGVVVDWERRGKARRQAGADTQINADTADDLARVRAATGGTVVCRVNGAGPWTREEVDLALGHGADEVLLPMVRTPDDVDLALDAVGGRAGLGILVETMDAVRCVDTLLSRPLRRVYVGLNDLRIDRCSDALFAPLLDGTVERVRRAAARSAGSGPGRLDFGVAGLTRPDAGHPVPSRLLAGELARLDASFTFLRRSFWRDVAGRDLAVEVPRILDAVAGARRRTSGQVVADRAELVAAVAGAAVPQAVGAR